MCWTLRIYYGEKANRSGADCVSMWTRFFLPQHQTEHYHTTTTISMRHLLLQAAHVFSRLWHNYIEKSFIFSLCLVALAPHYLFWERPRECVQKVTTSHRILQTLLSLRHPAFLKRKYAADHWTFVNKFHAAFFVCVPIQIACLKILGLLGLGRVCWSLGLLVG